MGMVEGTERDGDVVQSLKAVVSRMPVKEAPEPRAVESKHASGITKSKLTLGDKPLFDEGRKLAEGPAMKEAYKHTKYGECRGDVALGGKNPAHAQVGDKPTLNPQSGKRNAEGEDGKFKATKARSKLGCDGKMSNSCNVGVENNPDVRRSDIVPVDCDD